MPVPFRLIGSTDHGSYLYVDVTGVTQSISGNYTDVTWTAGIHWGSYFFNIHNAIVNMSTTVSGATVGSTTTTGTYNSGWPISGAGTDRDHPFHTGTTRVYHNSSGQGNIRFSGSAFWDTPGNFTSTLSSVVTLGNIVQLPGAPSTPAISSVTSTSVFATFTDGSTGGGTIDSRQIGYGTNSSTPTSTVASDGSTTVSGLTPGTTYYFWARTHNAKGYSAWSGRASKKTLNHPSAPGKPVLSEILPTSLKVSWTAPTDDGGSAITGYQVGYGTSSTTPSTIVSGTSPKTITGLSPGTTYFFWVRAINAVGTGPWSAFTANATIAGARIKVGAVWVIAVPYVRQSGVWKLAVPYVKIAGVWKPTG